MWQKCEVLKKRKPFSRGKFCSVFSEDVYSHFSFSNTCDGCVSGSGTCCPVDRWLGEAVNTSPCCKAVRVTQCCCAIYLPLVILLNSSCSHLCVFGCFSSLFKMCPLFSDSVTFSSIHPQEIQCVDR